MRALSKSAGSACLLRFGSRLRSLSVAQRRSGTIIQGIVQRVRLMDERRVEMQARCYPCRRRGGYGRLTAADEEGTIARLGRLRDELIAPCTASHRGRIVKTMGDGLLVAIVS
jgi:hypothetical protein